MGVSSARIFVFFSLALQFIAAVLFGPALSAENRKDEASQTVFNNEGPLIKTGLTHIQELIEDREDKIFKREALADPLPRSPQGTNSPSSHAGYNDKRTPSHRSLRLNRFHELSRGHSTQKREADPRSPHGTNSAFSHGGGFGNKPKPSHGALGSHGFRGVGGGHSTRKREANPANVQNRAADFKDNAMAFIELE